MSEKFECGYKITARDDAFAMAIKAAVDYRGDVTLILNDGRELEGYLYNDLDDTLDILPSDGSRKISTSLAEVRELFFSSEDRH